MPPENSKPNYDSWKINAKFNKISRRYIFSTHELLMRNVIGLNSALSGNGVDFNGPLAVLNFQW